MYVWNFAYKQARKGQWETIARDSARFRRRIVATGLKISKVFENTHRNKIYDNIYTYTVDNNFNTNNNTDC